MSCCRMIDEIEKTAPPVPQGVFGNSGPRPSLGRRMWDSFKRQEPSYEAREGGDGKGESFANGTDDLEGYADRKDDKLSKALQSRHIQMIAIGGCIGTGLFVGSGLALSQGGPAGLVIAFTIIGVSMYNVVQALGELAVMYPVEGSFSTYGARFIDPAWGFAMGWNYELLWLIVLPLELTAAGMVVSYWVTNINVGVFITIFLLLVSAINICHVRIYGEAEFYISLTKVIAVIAFIILGIVIDLGGAPNHTYHGVKTWKDPGAFANGIKGLISVFVTAAFSFGGTELVGLAAAEAENPRLAIPRACKQVFWRITFFYIASLTIIGFIVPYTEPRLLSGKSSYDANASPFVIAIEQAGIKVLPSLFNAVILISVLSVGISSSYGSSRTLNALAKNNHAPKIFAYVDRRGRPLISLLLSLSFGCLAYINLAPVGTKVFNWLVALSATSFLFIWGSTCLAHIRFRGAWKAQGHSLDELPFRAQFGVYGSWVGVIVNFLCLLAQFYNSLFPIGAKPSAEKFFQGYIAVPVIIFLFIFWKIHKKTKFCALKDIDLMTGRRKIDLVKLREEERIERLGWSMPKRVYRFLC